jgi:hypothetical protein
MNEHVDMYDSLVENFNATGFVQNTIALSSVVSSRPTPTPHAPRYLIINK